MKILVMERTAKVFSLECESTDTIAHLKAKLDKVIIGYLGFDGKLLGGEFSENRTLADIGVQDGSLILDLCWLSEPEDLDVQGRTPRRPENDYLHYADAFKSGWREEHAKAFLHLLLNLCQDGTISEGNMTDEAWLKIQNRLNNSKKCSFQIDFLKERLCDYKQLYSVLAETTSSSFFEWDRKRKIITIDHFCNWREEYPELLLLCRPHIQYFDTLKGVYLLVNATRSSEQRVSETATNINNAREASSSRGEICIRFPSDSNLSLMDSSTSIGKENGYLPSTWKILFVDETAKIFYVKCESTDTIAHLLAKLHKITRRTFRGEMDLMFDGKKLNDNFLENMMLVDAGVQDGSMIHSNFPRGVLESGLIERVRRQNDYLYYADVFKSGWSEEHAKALLHLLLKLCQDGTISEGNVTDKAWLTIQNCLKNSMKCNFQIDFLKERLCDYKRLYSVLAETRSSSFFKWDRERKIITINDFNNWREDYPELLLLRGNYISYFDTLENVCSLLNTGQSSRREFQNPVLSKFKSLFSKSQ